MSRADLSINDIRAAIRAQGAISVLDAIGILDSLSAAVAEEFRRTNDSDADQLVEWIDDAIEACTPGQLDHVLLRQTLRADAHRQSVKDAVQ